MPNGRTSAKWKWTDGRCRRNIDTQSIQKTWLTDMNMRRVYVGRYSIFNPRRRKSEFPLRWPLVQVMVSV